MACGGHEPSVGRLVHQGVFTCMEQVAGPAFEKPGIDLRLDHHRPP